LKPAPAIIDGFPAFAPRLALDNRGFRPESFARLVSAEERNFWFHARAQLVRWAVRHIAPAPRAIMEVGCGNGVILSELGELFPDARLTGSDVYTIGLHQAAKRVPRAELLQMDVVAMPFEDEFDLIVACDVIEHVERDDLALAEMRRSLHRGGRILLTVPQHPELWAPPDDYAYHKRRYRRHELMARVEAAGFRGVDCRSFTSLLYPILWWSRRRQRRARTYDPMQELDIGMVLNAVLGSVMTVERQLLRAGIDFPFGGSLLLMAELES